MSSTTTTIAPSRTETPATPFPPIPCRPLGRTGCEVTQFALGGEGVLRTHGRMPEAVAVIHRALDQGVNYCDTAPAYAGSLDYYGAALGERRREVFLASKTHDRTRDGSLRLLDESLKRLPHRPPRPLAAPRPAHARRPARHLRPRRRAGGAGRGARAGSRAVPRPDRPPRPGHPARRDGPVRLRHGAGGAQRGRRPPVLVRPQRAGRGGPQGDGRHRHEGLRRRHPGPRRRARADARAGHGLRPEPPRRLDRRHRLLQPGRGRPERRIARDFRPLDAPAMLAIEQHTGPNAGHFTSYKK